jgi:hypothetical protein
VPEGKSERSWMRIALGIAVVAALVVLGRQLGAALPRFAAWVESLGPWGPSLSCRGRC